MAKAKKWVFSKVIVKRMAISLVLGTLFWFLCAFLASNGGGQNFWWSPIMWNIIFNRFMIGFIVAILGLITVHPLFWFRMYPFLRWACAGAIISIDISFWPFIMGNQNASTIAIMTIFAWAIYGMIIDIVATKCAGEGVKEFESIK